MIHVSMRHEDVGDLEEAPGGERAEVPQIEEERAARPRKRDVQCRVPEEVVDEKRPEAAAHGYRARRCLLPRGLACVLDALSFLVEDGGQPLLESALGEI